MRLKIALVLLITAACLAWVLWGLDLSAFASTLAGARWIWLLPMALLQTGIHGARTRLMQLLIEPRVPYWPFFSLNAISNLAINVVPGRLGELVRPYLLLEQHEVPLGASFAAVFLARLIDVVMLLSLLLGVGLFVDLPAEGVVVAGVDVLRAGQRAFGAVAAGGVGFIVALVALGEPVIGLVARLLPAHPLADKLLEFLRGFVSGFRRLLREPARAAEAVTLSATAWGLTLGVVMMAAMAFDGVPRSLGAAATIWGVTIAGTIIAPTPGFFGSYEAFCVAALMLWGVGAELGSAFAIFLHLGQFAFTVLMGAVFLLWEGLSLSRLVEQSQAALGEDPPEVAS
ncbi:MAG: flippase-like domain-containing protein [Alphaproteobacteria bacterium]|nr:flippase-like domain-containing protein [Alphaproteobacteria bacterium]MCB9794483.1 flippase-like domain-containing protein [Alphaproteobacteria bacterium]